MSYLPLCRCHQHPAELSLLATPTNSTPSHVLTVPIPATVFHKWARLGFGLGFQRIGMCHIYKTPPPPRDVGRARHRAQHSFLDPASEPAVYPLSIRLLLLSPAARVQARQRFSGVRFRAQRRAPVLELDTTTSYCCPFLASGASVGSSYSNWLYRSFFIFRLRNTKIASTTPRSRPAAPPRTASPKALNTSPCPGPATPLAATYS